RQRAEDGIEVDGGPLRRRHLLREVRRAGRRILLHLRVRRARRCATVGRRRDRGGGRLRALLITANEEPGHRAGLLFCPPCGLPAWRRARAWTRPPPPPLFRASRPRLRRG